MLWTMQFRPSVRAVLEAMGDGEKHWADELYKQTGMARRNSATWALNWLARYGFITWSANELVVLGIDRTDRVYVLTDKGRAAVADLEAGYAVGRQGLPQ